MDREPVSERLIESIEACCPITGLIVVGIHLVAAIILGSVSRSCGKALR